MSHKKSWLFIVTLLVVLVSLATMACIPPANCSPGFWKQSQHFQYWVGFEPTGPYLDTGMTLLDALQGGKATQVSRFVVAGWLNAANPSAPCGE
jgi:hypothetical protein